MIETLEQRIRESIRGFSDPETGRDVVATGQVPKIEISGDKLDVTLELTTHARPVWEDTRRALEQRLRESFGNELPQISVRLAEHHRPPMALGEIGLTAKSVIAVGSGKGGVGKSTIAAAIAFGLKKAGCHVGLMDADVYGPSVPHLLGLSGRPEIIDQRIQPRMSGSVPVMSMGFLVPSDEAVVWRGPMLHGAITQFLRDTAWGPLDYLIIDMPPGTGDIALTLSQLLPLTGAVVVCTPQDVALLDAVKAIAMFRKVKIPVLGLVENMSGFVCPDCGKRYDIFGHGGAQRRAAELNIPVLAEVPITIPLRELGDQGRMPDTLDDPTLGPIFDQMCYRLVAGLASAHAAKPQMPSLPVL